MPDRRPTPPCAVLLRPRAAQNASPSLSVSYATGCADVACASNAEFSAAAAAAAAADLTIVALGIDQTIEDEGLDRIEITLPGLQVWSLLASVRMFCRINLAFLCITISE